LSIFLVDLIVALEIDRRVQSDRSGAGRAYHSAIGRFDRRHDQLLRQAAVQAVRTAHEKIDRAMLDRVATTAPGAHRGARSRGAALTWGTSISRWRASYLVPLHQELETLLTPAGPECRGPIMALMWRRAGPDHAAYIASWLEVLEGRQAFHLQRRSAGPVRRAPRIFLHGLQQPQALEQANAAFGRARIRPPRAAGATPANRPAPASPAARPGGCGAAPPPPRSTLSVTLLIEALTEAGHS
jgi:hypothetical protein